MAGGLDLSNLQAAIQGKTEFSSFRGLTKPYFDKIRLFSNLADSLAPI
jgi:hypothetical protein